MVQRVQRGTNCPLGNRKKTSTSKARARKNRQAVGTLHGEGIGSRVLVSMIGPNVTSMSATKSAIQSSDLRQTISALTTKHTTTEASVSATVNAA
jgi:hypothetical protein